MVYHGVPWYTTVYYATACYSMVWHAGLPEIVPAAVLAKPAGAAIISSNYCRNMLVILGDISCRFFVFSRGFVGSGAFLVRF